METPTNGQKSHVCCKCETPISRWDAECRDCATLILLEQQAEMAEWEAEMAEREE